MSNEQSIRDEMASALRGIHEADNTTWLDDANALLASTVIRRIQAEAGAEALRSYRTRLMDQNIDRFGIVLPDLHEVLDDLDEEADRIERGEVSRPVVTN